MPPCQHIVPVHGRSESKDGVQAARCQSASSSTAPPLTTTKSVCESTSESPSLVEVLLKDDRTDYLTARRQAKQLANMLHSIDTRLRLLHTSELPPAPSKAELALLLNDCKR